MTQILGKSILVRVSASFELVRVPVIRSRLYTHAALCYSRTKLSSHGWIFCFLSCKTRSLTRFSIVCSQFSILYSRRNQESRIESRNWDSPWTVNWLLNGTVCVTALLKDWLTNWLTDWVTVWLTGWIECWLFNWLTDWLDYLRDGS